MVPGLGYRVLGRLIRAFPQTSQNQAGWQAYRFSPTVAPRIQCKSGFREFRRRHFVEAASWEALFYLRAFSGK